MALFGSVEERRNHRNLPFAQRTSQALLEAKVISLILLFVYSLIKFTWSVRQFNFVRHRDRLDRAATKSPMPTAAMPAAPLASSSSPAKFRTGPAPYYFSVALLLWFVQPWFSSPRRRW